MNRLQKFGVVLGPALATAIALAPSPQGLDTPGQRALAVLALCVVWWLTTPVALPVTSLIGMALLPVLGVLSTSEAMALFGNQAVFFVVGVFLVAAAMLSTGLSKRLALWVMQYMTRSEDLLAGAVLLMSMGLCTVVVSHAVAAIMLPIVVAVVTALDLRTDSRTAQRLVLSMAWGTILGSNLTLLASARASLALSTYLKWAEQNTAELAPIGFLEFSMGTAAPMLLMAAMAYGWLRVTLPPEGLEMGPAVEKLRAGVSELGPMSASERRTIAVIVVMVPTFVLAGPVVGLGPIALLASGALFVLKVLSWEEAERYVNWGIILLYGGAIAIGAGLDKSGAMTWMVAEALPTEGVSPLLLVAGIAFAAMLLTEFVSNAAVIVIALPAVLAIAPAAGLDPRMLTVLMSVATGLAFSMPTSTPAMAMAYGTGYLDLRRGVRLGAPFSVACLVLMLLFVNFAWPVLGLGGL